MTAPRLFLIHGSESVALSDHAIAIGRLPECDVVLDGWEVSRRHARLVPTPAGPVLVDRSRFGTFVNNMQVIAPLLLADGDQIRIGTAEFRIVSAPPPGIQPRGAARAPRSRLTAWWKRYGLSELGGIGAALAGALGALHAGAGLLGAALAGTAAEAVWFYGSLAVRDLRYEARERRLANRPFDTRATADVLRNLAREFGPAESVDLLLRPVCFWTGLATLGGAPGVIAGKVAADLLFYGPVLAVCHWRMSGRAPRAAEPSRLRNTMAVVPQMAQLAELHRQLEARASTDESETPPTLHSDR